jgi:hypothetical protein
MPRARLLSFALLTIAVVEYGHLHIDHSGARPGAFGLTRLERDLERKIVQNTRIRIGDPYVEHRTDRINIGTGSADR